MGGCKAGEQRAYLSIDALHRIKIICPITMKQILMLSSLMLVEEPQYGSIESKQKSF
jgi:hypothetical protein